MHKKIAHVVQVAVPVPLRRLFDYDSEQPVQPGIRVLVSFGTRKLVGIVISNNPPTSSRSLKSISRTLDEAPVLDATMLALLTWAARYYHHPIGEVVSAALPVLMRSASEIAPPKGESHFQRISRPPAELSKLLARSPLQSAIYDQLSEITWSSQSTLQTRFKGWRNAINALATKSLIKTRNEIIASALPPSVDPVSLNQEQQFAANFICQQLGKFNAILLQGITGSGKTEVYLEAARQCIAVGKQVMILVPEISLTPQLIQRISQQLGSKVSTLHSGMTERARFETWWRAKNGMVNTVLGTRSAIFIQMQSLGLIVVDEEHDISYKQQDRFRYHAKDLAIKRASLEQLPVVLGSATPSLESLHNVELGRHHLLTLNKRIGAAKLPQIQPVDLNKHALENGLSNPVRKAIRQCLSQKQLAIIYINRRGYAPVVHCYGCQWQAVCERCNARMTSHRQRQQFRCHHCGYIEAASENCPQCNTPLYFAGVGTQRVEAALVEAFPDARICRLDRDQANTPNKLYAQLEAIKNGEVDVVVGTQLIAKGHDFDNASLVCVINADQGLFSADFRASEFMLQQLLQVSGRAGRAMDNGKVLIQTHHPDNPAIKKVQRHDYAGFAKDCLKERKLAIFPPCARFALFRAESVNASAAIEFLRHIRELIAANATPKLLSAVEVLHPVASPMEKLAGRFRAQLLVRSQNRALLHQLLAQWLLLIEDSKQAKNVRWSLDVDPMDMS